MNIYIIGASKGLGAGIAEAFAKLGHSLFICSRNLENLNTLSDQLTKNYNIKCNYNFLDVTQKESIIKSYNECVEIMGIPDIVIYNSGISKTDNFLNFQSQIIKDIYSINVYGLIDSMEIILPSLLKSGKKTIFAATSSLAELRGIPGNAGYSSSKIAVSHLLEAARCQLYKTNVKIITIKPGFVHTDMTSNSKFSMPLVKYPDKAGEIIARKLLKRKSIVAFPVIIQFLSWAAKPIPSFIYDFIMKNLWKKNKMLEDYL